MRERVREIEIEKEKTNQQNKISHEEERYYRERKIERERERTNQQNKISCAEERESDRERQSVRENVCVCLRERERERERERGQINKIKSPVQKR